MNEQKVELENANKKVEEGEKAAKKERKEQEKLVQKYIEMEKDALKKAAQIKKELGQVKEIQDLYITASQKAEKERKQKDHFADLTSVMKNKTLALEQKIQMFSKQREVDKKSHNEL